MDENANSEIFRVRSLSEYGTFTAIAVLFQGPQESQEGSRRAAGEALCRRLMHAFHAIGLGLYSIPLGGLLERAGCDTI